MNKGEIGRRMKGCRIALNISTAEIAEHLGLTAQRVNAIERELDDQHTIIRYLLYLRENGADLNLIFSNTTNQ